MLRGGANSAPPPVKLAPASWATRKTLPLVFGQVGEAINDVFRLEVHGELNVLLTININTLLLVIDLTKMYRNT